jgi:hypothetical protein
MTKSEQTQHRILVPDIIYLHFNTLDDHTFPLNDFIKSAQATNKIIQDINTHIFQGSLDYELVVIPPKDGTFLTRLGVYLKVATAAAIFINQSSQLLERQVPIAFVEGLTGKTPVELARDFGKDISQALASNDTKVPTEFVGHVLGECARGFLEKPEDLLNSKGITPETFNDGFRARNEFYQTCIENPKVMAIGFDATPNFPIQRSAFANQVVSVPEKKDDEPWAQQVVNVRVESPNWNRYSNRRWFGKFTEDDKEKEVYFSIQDDGFWEAVKQEHISPKVMDSLVVQWVRPKHRGRQDAVVLRVLDFNGQKISQPMTDAEVKEFLEKSAHVLAVDDQDDLQLNLGL